MASSSLTFCLPPLLFPNLSSRIVVRVMFLKGKPNCIVSLLNTLMTSQLVEKPTSKVQTLPFNSGSSDTAQIFPYLSSSISCRFLRSFCSAVRCAVLSRSPCLILCDPTDCSPPGSSVHGHSRGTNTEVGCVALLIPFYEMTQHRALLIEDEYILAILISYGFSGSSIIGRKRF